ncbi:MAG: PKD domain-containing protein, partial [Peptococcaceae bacterium]|nr:PKD domain-containing protein [Peptococcaceae bacterium]
MLNLSPDTEYIFRVVGYDHISNRGVPSDDIATRTSSDTTAPVISSLTPRPISGETSYYSTSVLVSATAEDDNAVKSLDIQVSTDKTNWVSVFAAEYSTPQKKQTASYAIDLMTYSEGPIFVRAIAVDYAGNISDSSSSAPFVQYIIDRTPPAAPTGVQAAGRNGSIEVSWLKGTEKDLWCYSVYRSMLQESGFQLIASSLLSLNYIDRSINEDVTYYYKVSVKDFAGNESILSETASAQMAEDTEPPIIAGFYPKQGAQIGSGNRAVSIYVTDNRMIDEIKVEYKKSGASYRVLQAFIDFNDFEETVTVTIPLDDFYHGEVISLRITAADKSGNISESKEINYFADKEAPVIISPKAVYEPGSGYVTISWVSDLSEGLAGYRIYRKSSEGDYALVKSVSAKASQLDYTFNDRSIALTSEQYTYRVDAVSNTGNTSGAYTNQVTTDKRDVPVAVIDCDSVMETGVQYVIDAAQSTSNASIVSYSFDFGDGTTATNRRAVHSYSENGTYVITLTVTDDEGSAGSVIKEV